jgi:diguanylate cyclase
VLEAMRMRTPRGRPKLTRGLSLTRQVALLSLLPIVILGFILAHVLQTQIVARTLSDASETARIIARIGIQPRLSPQAMRTGLTPAGVRALDQQLSARSVSQDLARIKIWNARHEVVYSDDHRLIGRTLTPSDDLLAALAGRPDAAEVVNPSPHSETASEVGLGRLVEVYVPLRFKPSGPPAGAFEIYLSYRPIAAALASNKRTIALLVAIGLALLWAILYRIVGQASRKLSRQARENHRLARCDQLTGLPNRTKFIEGVTTAAAEQDARNDHVAVLMIDLDRFTEINNTLGNANGDRVLWEVARRLCDDLPEGTLVARLGGDEYAVLSRRGHGSVGALETAAAVQTSLEAPIVLDGVALNVEVSIGIAVLGEHAQDAAGLLRSADAALAHARSHCSRVEVYSPQLECFDPTRLLLLGQVRAALAEDEFVVCYQPEVDLQAKRIVRVEALVRWQHPQRGMLPPLSFIPLIEQTALIGPLTLHVIDRALAQLVQWRKLGLALGMSVNLSARNLLDAELPAKIADLLRRHGVAPEQLTVEVTESASMVDHDRAVTVLRALRASGVGVSIDDFGTGNASIEYLTTLPASEIKIDRSFITDILEDTRAQAIVCSTVDLARNLGLAVVAEGIETEAVMEHLTTLGCDTGQGYFISRPLPAEELTAQLAQSCGVAAGQLGPGNGRAQLARIAS